MKITIVLPDGKRQPIEVSEQATLRRLLPALAAKIALPRRDEAGTAVAYYATYQNKPIPDDQPLTALNLPDDAELVLHPVTILDPHEAIELEPEPEPEHPHLQPSLPRPTPIPRRRERQRPFFSRIRRFMVIGCGLIILLCCVSYILVMGLIRTLSDDGGGTSVEAVSFDDNSSLWNFVPQDAEYSSGLERLIMISSDPDQLHIYSPLTRQNQVITLSAKPTAVSISPNGRWAAVGHDHSTSLINLETQDASRLFNLSLTTSADIVLTEDWIYVSGTSESGGQLYSVRISDNFQQATTLSPTNDLIHSVRLAADGRSLYGTTRGTEFGRLEKIDITRGEPQFMYDSGDVADTCGEVWLSEDGRYAFTGCGHIWRLADQRQNDMVLLGNFFAVPEKITALAHSTAGERILLITEANDSQVLVFDNDGSTLLSTRSLPESTHGRYLFINSQGTQYYAIVQTEDGPFGLFTGNLHQE